MPHANFIILWTRATAITPLSLHQGDLRHLRSVSQAPTKLGDACKATRTPGIAWSEFVKNLFDDQLIRQRLQNLAAGMQLDHHRAVCSLQSRCCLIFVRDDAQQFFTAILELLLRKSTSLIRQRRQGYFCALLVGKDLFIERETALARKCQYSRRLLFIRDDRSQVLASGCLPFDGNRDQFFSFTANGAGARLGSFNTVIAEETCHHVATRRASAWLRHTHPITGNSVPQLIPPFRGRRPGRPQSCWYADSAGSCATAVFHVVPVDSSLRSCAPLAGRLHSSKAPGQPW